MQFYALDGQNLIRIAEAKKGRDYFCPECHAPVRARGGLHRQDHFYHPRAPLHCRQAGKTLAHLQIQEFLRRLFPPDEIAIERPFPEINRIADAVWEKEKLVFEVQCSGISLTEAKERCHDYERAGYFPIWILYDKKFNKRRLTEAELYLRGRACYFSKGAGSIYDQTEILSGAIRKSKGVPFAIDLRQVVKAETGVVYKNEKVKKILEFDSREKTGWYHLLLAHLLARVSD